MSSHRTGLLVIRAWVEEGSDEPLRAQMRVFDDVSSGIERTLTMVRPDGVGQVVEDWVRTILERATPTSEPDRP